MRRLTFVSFVLTAMPALAADDATTVLSKAQSAWLRGSEAELTQLAGANARWASSASASEQYSYAFLQFRLLQLASTKRNQDVASKASDACVTSANKAAEAAKTGAIAAEARALQSACYGYVAGAGGMMAAIRNGRASGKAMEQALALEARNPRVLLVDAFGLYFRPKIAGGDKLKACARFREASAAFDRAAATAPTGWGPTEAHFWVGRCLLDTKDATGARREFETALKLAPDFAAAQRALRATS
jgi:tetratricopeptide (TPR) repeat protein